MRPDDFERIPDTLIRENGQSIVSQQLAFAAVCQLPLAVACRRGEHAEINRLQPGGSGAEDFRRLLPGSLRGLARSNQARQRPTPGS